MKKGSSVLLLICAFSLCLVIGIFIGRNLNDDYTSFPQNDIKVDMNTPDADADYRLDINIATKAQLMELPGIGEMIADRILAYRTQYGQFQAIEDLMNVEGIGNKKLLQIESLIKVGG